MAALSIIPDKAEIRLRRYSATGTPCQLVMLGAEDNNNVTLLTIDVSRITAGFTDYHSETYRVKTNRHLFSPIEAYRGRECAARRPSPYPQVSWCGPLPSYDRKGI